MESKAPLAKTIWGTPAPALLLAGAVLLAWTFFAPANALVVAVAGCFALAAGGAVIGAYAKSLAATALAHESRAEALSQEVLRHRRALDDLADGLVEMLFLAEAQGNIVYANRSARENFKFDDPTGRPILAVTQSSELEDLVLEAVRSGLPQKKEVVTRHPTERRCLVNAWPEALDQNRAFVSIYDISDLRKLERVRRDFVANVSHELRTPMTTIRFMAETLADEVDDDNEEAKKYLSRIIREIDRLTSVTQDLLTLSEAEALPPHKNEVDLAELAKDVINQLSPKARDKGLEISYRGPDTAVLDANETQMRQVLLNLVDNAIKYTQEGSVSIMLEAYDQQLVISVSDTGVGIATDHQPRIFERFYRVDKARSKAGGGTGLGLSIVRNIVEAHGGNVELESALNRGSTFSVTLPMR